MATLAYLVIREGATWTDVFRLIPGQSVTLGRSPTNQIVLKDERCSRNHAEVMSVDDAWVLRDLHSRNGTAVGAKLIEEDYELNPGDIIRIGRSQLAFVHDLSNAFAGQGSEAAGGDNGSGTLVGSQGSVDPESIFIPHEPTKITHRRGQTKFLEAHDDLDESGISRLGRAAAILARLAFDLAKAADVNVLADLALAGVFERTQADTGALWLLPKPTSGEPKEASLKIVASGATSDVPYHRVSPFLANTVLREREAVLARNVEDDSTVTTRDSHGEIHATSVICAPIRLNDRMFGLLHLYSSDAVRVLDPDDLEFTLAVADTVAVALDNLGRQQQLVENLTQVQDEIVQLRERYGAGGDIIGKSEAHRAVADEIARTARSKATVLIRGESGVGKELVARAIHMSSQRRNGPFVCVNCAALSETLLESELFGHEKGAFTGATDRKIGKFEAAHGGTLLLDEIGEMSPTIQAKFLRVLEGHAFERVGGSDPVQVDVRVIAATNRDLEQAIREKAFRRDLYFRLNVLPINVSPLRKRTEDIPVLAHHFLEMIAAETGRKVVGFTRPAMEQMVRYRWPGNIRELKNVVERAVLLTQDDVIDQSHLMLSTLPTAGDTGSYHTGDVDEFTPESLAEVEKRHISDTLDATGWNKSKAASILGIERSTLDRKIRRYDLSRSSSQRGFA